MMKTNYRASAFLFSIIALLCFSPNLTAQDQKSDERTAADAFEWLQEKMEQFKFNNYYGSGRKAYRETYKYSILGFEGCTVKIQEEYDYVRQINSTKDDRHNVKEWTINFAEVASITDNSDNYKPNFYFKSKNDLDKFVYKYQNSDYSYTTSGFSFYVDELGELTDEPQRLVGAFQFLIDKCAPPKKVEKFD